MASCTQPDSAPTAVGAVIYAWRSDVVIFNFPERQSIPEKGSREPLSIPFRYVACLKNRSACLVSGEKIKYFTPSLTFSDSVHSPSRLVAVVVYSAKSMDLTNKEDASYTKQHEGIAKSARKMSSDSCASKAVNELRSNVP